MIRLFLVFSAILMLAAGAAWLADHPGSVHVHLGSQEIYTSIAALALLAAILMTLTGGLVWLIGWARRELPVVGKNRVIKRQSRGLQLLNKSLVALSAGDHRLSRRLVEEAEVLLPAMPMVHLIGAEAATRSGDHAAAQKRYKALEGTEDGRLIGLRGLLQEAKRSGAASEALRLARVAFQENRKSPWVIRTLFALEVAAANWEQAEDALKIALREKLIDADTGKSHKAAIHYAEAMELQLAGKKTEARKKLQQAAKEKAGFIAAIVALARLDLTDGKPKAADKAIKAAWKEVPHPALISVYKEIDASESRDDWLKRVRALVDMNPDHPESRLLLVDGMMDARHYDAVKPVLEDLLHQTPSRRALQYRLALAHGIGEDADPFEAALETASDPAFWQCRDCGHRPRSWSVLCENCGAFDMVVWQETASAAAQPSFDGDKTITLLLDESA